MKNTLSEFVRRRFTIVVMFILVLLSIMIGSCKKVDPYLNEECKKTDITGEWVLCDAAKYFADSGTQRFSWLPDTISVYLNNHTGCIQDLITIYETIRIENGIVKKNGIETAFTDRSESATGWRFDITSCANDQVSTYLFRQLSDEKMIVETNGTTGECYILEYTRPKSKNIRRNIDLNVETQYTKAGNDYSSSKLVSWYNTTPQFYSEDLLGVWVFESYQYIQPYAGPRMILNDTISFDSTSYIFKGVRNSYSCYFGGNSLNYIALNITNLDMLGTIRTSNLPNSFTNLIDIVFTTGTGQNVRIILKRVNQN